MVDIIYIYPQDDKQNYLLCRLNLLDKMFGHYQTIQVQTLFRSKHYLGPNTKILQLHTHYQFGTNQSISNKSNRMKQSLVLHSDILTYNFGEHCTLFSLQQFGCPMSRTSLGKMIDCQPSAKIGQRKQIVLQSSYAFFLKKRMSRKLGQCYASKVLWQVFAPNRRDARLKNI